MSALHRRSLLLAALTPAGARAQTAWAPRRPVTWVLGYPPGGGSDFVARLVAQGLSRRLGQPVVVENRPGGGAVLAPSLVARAAPDGHTLMTGDNGSLVCNAFLHRNLSYDPVRDFRLVGGLATFHLVVLVPRGSPIRSLADLSGRRRVTYGSSGVGSPQHLACARLLAKLGAPEPIHVPSRGGAGVLLELLGGRVDLALLDTATSRQALLAGELRPLGVTAPWRLASLPEVPTVIEQGLPDFIAQAWQGMVVPVATPDAAVARLSAELGAVLADPLVRGRLREGLAEPMPLSPSAFASFLTEEREVWGKLIQQLGVRVDG